MYIINHVCSVLSSGRAPVTYVRRFNKWLGVSSTCYWSGSARVFSWGLTVARDILTNGEIGVVSFFLDIWLVHSVMFDQTLVCRCPLSGEAYMIRTPLSLSAHHCPWSKPSCKTPIPWLRILPLFSYFLPFFLSFFLPFFFPSSLPSFSRSFLPNSHPFLSLPAFPLDQYRGYLGRAPYVIGPRTFTNPDLILCLT